MNSRRRQDRIKHAVRIVAEVGNARLKWGVCDVTAVARIASLPPDNPAAWNDQLTAWGLKDSIEWAVSGVHPLRRDDLVTWLQQRGDRVQLISSHKQLPLKVSVPMPDKVGIDRLLNAVAVNTRRQSNMPAVIVDAGSAITVDYLDKDGVFQGGAIMPGLRMMAKSLHENTALLPLIELNCDYSVPGNSTSESISAGIMCAAVGGIKQFVSELLESESIEEGLQLFLGGGDGHLFESEFKQSVTLWPQMTLEGMRIAAWPEAGK